jgi:Holliday junction resolvase RusA-like endonuclease
MARVSISIAGRPVPKSRPRFGIGLGRPYTPQATLQYENLIAWECRAARIRLGGVPVEVTIELHAPTLLRGDVDNYAKAVLDGLQKGEAIDDDRQVVSLKVRKVIGSEPNTVVHIRRLSRQAGAA